MSDIQTRTRTLDLRTDPAGLSLTRPPRPAPTPAVPAQPASQLHRPKTGGAPVLDLRTLPNSQIASTSSTATPPVATTPSVPVRASGVTLEAALKTAPQPAPVVPGKIINPVGSLPAQAQPSPQAVSQPTSRSPLIKRFLPHPATVQPTQSMPNAVTTQIEALAATARAPSVPTFKSPDLEKAISAAKQPAVPNAVRFGAATIAIVIMAGAIWLQNSPKLAFHNAASQVGINASLPTFIPSSYRQNGPVKQSDGQLTLEFTSPSASTPLKIVQHRSSWDSSSLRENYVTHQTDSFLAVQGQGLTIYLYGGQASWINHGVWYEVSGASKLSREQILKIAYGL